MNPQGTKLQILAGGGHGLSVVKSEWIRAALKKNLRATLASKRRRAALNPEVVTGSVVVIFL